MAIQISPGISVSEYNLTTTVPPVATTEGAIAGVFSWGPVNERVLVTSETELVNVFGKPTSSNYETFFTAADFLAYSNKLYVVRVAATAANNAMSSGSGQFLTEDAALANTTVGTLIARYPGALGNSLLVSVCPNANAYSNAISNVTISTGSTTANTSDYTKLAVGDILRVGNSSIGYQDLVVANSSTSTVTFTSKYTLAGNLTSADATRKWGYYKLIKSGKAPANANQVHIAVIDEDGTITGTAGNVLEVYENVSVNPAATKNGVTNYYKNVINGSSQWLYATGNTISTSDAVSYSSFIGGTSGAEQTIGFNKLTAGYDLFKSPQDVDVSFILAGKPREGTYNEGLANYIIDNICEVRKDCIAFISPATANVAAPQAWTAGDETDEIVAFRNALTSSSYAFLDSGYKYRYDRYNDVYRWTPVNGDIAGIVARTAQEKDPWWSPAGYNRGKLKNVVKLAFNPNPAHRDILYPSDVNPVITQAGEGTLLFGDKTLIGDGSAFDRVNVRRLFIILEKAIAKSAKSTLFEFNDAFTRAQFKNLIEPYLRDVQGRRGIYDFKVVCDETNNTPQVIDSNQFVGDIYIKPARSINYIQLNFVAVGTGVSFNEIVGQV
jgi:phage tail sheath protein FI